MAATLVLTPSKQNRRTRPSWSPLNSGPMISPPKIPRAKTPTEPLSLTKPLAGSKESNEQMASLQFPFSTWKNNKYVILQPEEHAILDRYLWEHFTATSIEYSGPYLIIECQHVPAPNERPFLVADSIAIWREEEEPPPGDFGPHGELAGGPPANLPDGIKKDLMPYRIPSADTVDSVMQLLFPDALAISYLMADFVIELPETDLKSFCTRLETLPMGIVGCGVGLVYRNGPLELACHGRIKEPCPKPLGGHVDDTDYISESGRFSPGSMIRSSEGNMISAGIAVRRGQQERLTVAIHCWQSELDTKPNKLGNPEEFRVLQGKTKIGNVIDRLNESDIGLACLDQGIKMSQTFLEIDFTPKRLMKASEFVVRDLYAIDPFTTGLQTLACMGLRMQNNDPCHRASHEPNPERTYAKFDQGIFSTNAPEITGRLMIRDGVCGSAIVRQLRLKDRKNMFPAGEVAGFMVWSDISHSYRNPERLLCYAELAEDGRSLSPGRARG